MNYYFLISNLTINVRGHDNKCLSNHNLNIQKELFVELIGQYTYDLNKLLYQTTEIKNINILYIQLSSDLNLTLKWGKI